MASHVVVIDSTARRHTIKCTPTKHLSDILQEACGKFGVDANQYSLKHNDKPIDLSRTIRLSGLLNGAKLSLVQASRSPSVVNVALQLPEARLTDKFPSDTPLWQVLRRFEDGTAGNASGAKTNHNFTQRAVPVTTGGTSGSGHLNYEMPVVNIMGRELATFLDLQKTLAQLGFNGGSCLLRLSYRDSGQPMSEAMEQITQYFKSIEPAAAATGTTDTHGAHGKDVGEAQSTMDVDTANELDNIAGERVTADNRTTESTLASPETSAPFASPSPGIADSPMPDFDTPTPGDAPPPYAPPPYAPTSSLSRPPPSSNIAIFAPPTSTTSHTLAGSTYDEADYLPTIDHAQLHQARLASESRNRKLLSDSELAAASQARLETLSKIKEVVVRIRFPDQSMAQRPFGQSSSVADVYAMCREVMEHGDERFEVRVPAVGAAGRPSGMSALSETGQEGQKKLIKDLGWQGRVLVTVVWAEGVAKEVKEAPSLKQQYRAVAEEIKLPVVDEQGTGKGGKTVVEEGVKKDDKPKKSVDKESKMRGLLKGLSKK